jgi:hypothetical protein
MPLRHVHKAFSKREHSKTLLVIVQCMKLGLLSNEFFGSGLDRVKVRQVQLEKEDGFLLCDALKFIDHCLCLIRRPSGNIYFSPLR